MAANKLLPSVITGNTVVVKPSPYTPLATVMLSEMAAEAFPAGVMNIMTGGDELGQMMVEHPNIAQISFTGSAATGKKIMATGAATLKKVTLELGGNDPAVILPDVDPKDVAPKIFSGAMRTSSESVVSINLLRLSQLLSDFAPFELQTIRKLCQPPLSLAGTTCPAVCALLARAATPALSHRSNCLTLSEH
jgi:acyl-CoA reductase-like NAD-dependent aldehyde dehydrogenase